MLSWAEAGTGSEMNAGAVITNHEQKLKIGHVFDENVMPKFSILNPKFTFSLPKRQMVDGITDGTIILEGGYKVLTKDEVRRIVRASL